jgi:hypothetical protein
MTYVPQVYFLALSGLTIAAILTSQTLF